MQSNMASSRYKKFQRYRILSEQKQDAADIGGMKYINENKTKQIVTSHKND